MEADGPSSFRFGCHQLANRIEYDSELLVVLLLQCRQLAGQIGVRAPPADSHRGLMCPEGAMAFRPGLGRRAYPGKRMPTHTVNPERVAAMSCSDTRSRAATAPSTRNGLRPSRAATHNPGPQPRGGWWWTVVDPPPRVAARRQPWAGGRNRVAVGLDPWRAIGPLPIRMAVGLDTSEKYVHGMDMFQKRVQENEKNGHVIAATRDSAHFRGQTGMPSAPPTQGACVGLYAITKPL